jgi:ADP-ribosyl-[dinitrogen reductase] hydrolase
MDAGIDSFLDLTQPEEFDPYELDLPPGVHYERRPIRDHSLPSRREHMSEILRYVDRELRAGRRVYVHCHAGIGRTGMVAGCFLVERGAPGEAALVELNRLWQQCARSSGWPYIPETDEQASYVRNWKAGGKRDPVVQGKRDPVAQLEAMPLRAPGKRRGAAAVANSLQDRFQGALVGLAVGDALANAVQGLKPGTFEPVTGFTGGGTLELPAGAWSDDTATALCIAESLLECNASDPRDQVSRFTRWQQEGHLSATGECVGIAPGTARALGSARWRRQIYPGSHDPRQMNPEVLSRVAPPVMFGFGSVEVVTHLACESARITCQAPGALDACRLLAAALHSAIEGARKPDVLDPTNELQDTINVRGKVAEARQRAAERTPKALAGVVEVLAAAFWAFETTANFADGALRAASLGGSCDVVAAVYGQLAGAHYGLQAIPAAWRSALLRRDLIIGFADRLYAHSQAA